MPSTSLSFFILGVLVASVGADNSTSLLPNIFMSDNVTVTSTWDKNNSSATAEGKGNGTTIGPIKTTMLPMTTFTTNKPSTITTSNRKEEALTNNPKKPQEPVAHSDDSTGIIILVVIILVALGFGVACYCARKRGRRYSVDLNSRADGANIPLSTVEPEMTAEAGTQNGHFENTNVSTKEAVAETKAEEQLEKKGEAENTAADPSAESAAPAKSPDSVEVDPKGDAIEPTGPASVHLSVGELTDEGLDSNKTSVESLREANENNSNNGGPRRHRDLFWDIPLSDSV